jgi:hypothetical protein
MGNIRRQGRRDANAEQLLRPSRDRYLAARRIKQHHRTRIDQPVLRGRNQTSRPPAVIANSVVNAMSIMYVRCESNLGHVVIVS